MHLVIDLQCCQNGSRDRGIGRYALEITKAILRLKTGHEFSIVLSDRFPHTISPLRRELNGLIDQDRIFVLSMISCTSAADPDNSWRRRAAEIIRGYAIESLRPDVVFIPSLFEGLWDDTLVSVENGPYLTAVTAHDFIPLTYPEQHLEKPQDRLAYQRQVQNFRTADLFLAISEHVERECVGLLNIAPDKIVNTLEGSDARFQPGKLIQKQNLMDKYGISKPFVLNTSPLEFRKNVEGMIAGFGSLPSNLRKQHQLVIVGRMDGNARNFIARLAKKEGLAASDIVLTGFVSDEDLVDLYRACEVFVFPSLSEGFGLPALEAMACGAAVIGSNVTSIPEVIGRKDTLFDPQEPGDIALVMMRVLSNNDFKSELRGYSIQQASLFSWDKSARCAIDGFEMLYKRKPVVSTAPLASVHARPRIKPSLAFVSSMAAERSRITGYNRTILPEMAAYYDVTIISLDGRPEAGWEIADNEVHDEYWFTKNAGRFDRILYSFDKFADEQKIELIGRFPGTVLLHDRSYDRFDRLRAGSMMSARLQKDLYIRKGLYGFVDVLSIDHTDSIAAAIIGEELRTLSMGILSEAEPAAGEDVARQIPILSVRIPPALGKKLKSELGMLEATPLIVGLMTSTEAGSSLINIFRRCAATQTSQAHLVLYILSQSSTDPRLASQLMGTRPGRIHFLGQEIDHQYLALLSAASAIVVSADADAGFLAHLQQDLTSGHPLIIVDNSCMDLDTSKSIAGTASQAERLTQEIEAVLSKQDCGACEHFGVTHASRFHPTSTDIAQKICDGIEHFFVWSPAGRYKQLISSFPQVCRNVRPDADDLVKVAKAMADNEVLKRAPQIFLDVTSLSAHGTRLYPDRFTRKLVTDFVKAAGSSGGIELICFDGERFITARQFTGKLLGLYQTYLPDEALSIRPGDKLISIDVLSPFCKESLRELLHLQAKGAQFCLIAYETFLFDFPDWASSAAAMAISTLKGIPSSINSSLIINPTGLKSRFAVPHPSNIRTETILNFARDANTAGIAINILAMDPRSPLPGLLYKSIEAFPSIRETTIGTWPDQTPSRAPVRLGESSEPNSASDLNELDYVITGHIQWIYSLAIINRAVARSLEKENPGRVRILAVETVPVDNADNVPTDERPLIYELMNRLPSQAGREIIISQHYPLLVPQGKFVLSLALFAWEETHVPKAAIEKLSKGFDAVLVPSSSVGRALINSGIGIPVAITGQPADVEIFCQLGEQKRPMRHGPKIFLHVSSCFPRKGVDVLLEAWVRAFSRTDDVKLLIKTFPNPHNTVEEDVSSLQKIFPDTAPVEIINIDVDKYEMKCLYQKADVMVLPSRGEGYNLPALEAMLAGIPLIVSGYGGHLDFCSKREARLVDFEFRSSNSHVRQEHSLWIEPNRDDLIAALREMIDPSQQTIIEERRLRARQAALAAADHSGWLRRFHSATRALLDRMPAQSPQIAWISTWGIRCGIAQYSEFIINAFPPEFREKTFVLCDIRTAPQHLPSVPFEPLWIMGPSPKQEELTGAINRLAANAIVIQHQDGLISWEDLTIILNDPSFRARVTIVVLHNPRNIYILSEEEKQALVASLRLATRILVHNIVDINYLKSAGLVENVTLFPHGAIAMNNPPPVRNFSHESSGPVIGCHGFFLPHKGIDKLLRAAAILRTEWPGLKVRLVNARFPERISDEVIGQCETLAAELDLGSAIEWYTDFLPVARINALLSECDVLVLPYDESFDSASGAVRTALSSLVPVVATKVRIFEELLDSVAWADNNTPNILAKEIGDLLKSPQQREMLQKNMIDWLASHDWTRLASVFGSMIKTLIDQKSIGFGC